jgi:putative colanic acid biosynthesis UDP-glucose lipid carrier transferase
MNQQYVYKHSLFVAVVASFQAMFVPVVAAGGLYVLCLWTETVFDAEFTVFAALVVLLSVVLLPPGRATNTGQLAPTRLPVAAGIVWRWGLLLFVLAAIGYSTKASAHFSRQVVLTWALVTPVILVTGLLLLQTLMRRITVGAENSRRAIFAGCNEVSISLCARLERNPEASMHCMGFFDDRGLDRLGPGYSDVRLLGRLPELGAYVKQHGIDVIFIALPVRHVQRVMDLLDDLRDTTASIYYVPDIFVFDLIQARTSDLFGIPVVAMCETPFYGYRGALKRVLDISISAALLLLLAPFLLLIMLLVRLTSPGPVIFRQRRYGLDGKQITIYKFRSMTVTEDGEQVAQAQKDDSRFTPIGAFLRRYSLDELPQLLNVLQGRMSLVGPRPHAVAHNEEYRKLIKGYMIRHKVLPGITGLAQVNGCRGETSKIEEMQRRVQFDLDYLRHWSPTLDLKILGLTLLRALRDEKAY